MKTKSLMTDGQKVDRMYQSLHNKAVRAINARDALETALEKAKASPLWEKMCTEYGVSASANMDDWMA